MKTPRNILFQRHRQAEPKLDEVRRKALSQLSSAASVEAPATTWPPGLILALPKKICLELIWPSRRAWAAMAALWLIVGLANMEMRMSVQGLPRSRSASVRELAQGLQEQRRLLSELLQTAKTPLADPPRPNPSPRSERQPSLRPC